VLTEVNAVQAFKADPNARGRDDGCVVTAALYAKAEPMRPVALEEIDGLRVAEHELLWVDVRGGPADAIDELAARLGFAAVGESSSDAGMHPELRNLGESFQIRVIAVRMDAQLKLQRDAFTIVCGPNVVLSVATRELEPIAAVRERQRDNVELGVLAAESFVVSLLDEHLDTYFDALSTLEAQIEDLELKLLSPREHDCLDRLRALRHASSRLRRLLSEHRPVYSGFARPDFRPHQSPDVNQHFSALSSRYERAVDTAEHGRDLVVGTFELFTTRAAMSTNRTMQVLTFVTVLSGALAFLASVLGMNFEAPFFASGERGFWVAIASMAAIAALSLWIGRRRDWI
jgi:magnesium transporter